MLTGDEDRLTLDFKKGSVACLTLPPVIVLGAATLNWILTPRLANP